METRMTQPVLVGDHLVLRTATEEAEIDQLRQTLNQGHYLMAGRPADHVLWQGIYRTDTEADCPEHVAVPCWGGVAKRPPSGGELSRSRRAQPWKAGASVGADGQSFPAAAGNPGAGPAGGDAGAAGDLQPGMEQPLPAVGPRSSRDSVSSRSASLQSHVVRCHPWVILIVAGQLRVSVRICRAWRVF